MSSTATLVDWRLGPSLGPPRQAGGAGSDEVADGVDDGTGPVDGMGGRGRAGCVGRSPVGVHSIANALDGWQVATGVLGGVAGGLLGEAVGGVVGGVDGDEVGGVTGGVLDGVSDGDGECETTGGDGGNSSDAT